MECFLCVQPCSKYFMCIVSFNPQRKSMKSVLCTLALEVKTLKHSKFMNLLQVSVSRVRIQTQVCLK